MLTSTDPHGYKPSVTLTARLIVIFHYLKPFLAKFPACAYIAFLFFVFPMLTEGLMGFYRSGRLIFGFAEPVTR
jgi:hypothetical protein